MKFFLAAAVFLALLSPASAQTPTPGPSDCCDCAGATCANPVAGSCGICTIVTNASCSNVLAPCVPFTATPTVTPTPTCGTTTYVVNSNADTDDGCCDSANCTLRECINAANASTSKTCSFAISGGGAHTITLGSDLPTLTAAGTVIDGSTQSGSSCGDLWGGTVPTWNIVIDANTHNVFAVTGGTTTIEGLSLKNGVVGYTANTNPNNIVRCNQFDSFSGGSAVSPGAGDQVGGPSAGDGNVVINNSVFDGIDPVASVAGGSIEGNFIGITAAGTTAASNEDGIYLSANTGWDIKHNLSSGNRHYGIHLDNGSSGNTVENNWVGLNRAGTGAVPNQFDGVQLERTCVTNTIGPGNVISANTASGINVKDADCTGNTVTTNDIGTDGAGGSSDPSLCNGSPQTQDADSNTFTGNTIGSQCDPTPTPLPAGCCPVLNADPGTGPVICVDSTLGGGALTSQADCQALLAGGGVAPPATAGPWQAKNCDPPGDTSAGTCAAPTSTPTVPTPTSTPTGAVTNTPTTGPTTGATPTCPPDLSLCNAVCASPPCDGAYRGANSALNGTRKRVSCTTDGTATVQTMCREGSGYFAGTPIPVGTPIVCPGYTSFVDTFQDCLCEVTANSGGAHTTCAIRARSDAVDVP